MDTKLKNNHKLAVLAITLCILLPSIGMLMLYPYFNQETSTFKENFYTRDDFVQSLVRGGYVLYGDQKQRSSETALAPYQIFYPMMDEIENTAESSDYQNEYDYDYQTSPIANFQYLYREWQNQFQEVRPYLQYQMRDANNELLDKNVSDSLWDKLKADKDGNYLWGVVLTYDDKGNLQIENTYGKNGDSMISKLEYWDQREPLQDTYGDYTYQKTGPKNITLVFAMTVKDSANYLSNAYSNSYWDYINIDALLQVIAFLAALVAFAALLLPLIRPLNTGREKVFRAPLELTCLGAAPIMLLLSLMPRLIQRTNDRVITQILRQAGLTGPNVIQAVTYIWNLFWWLLLFGFIYWIAACLRDIFFGPIRYFKERTLLFRLFKWVQKSVKQVYHLFADIDLRQTTNRLLIKIVGINFIILLLICSLWFFGIAALLIYSIILFFILHKYFNDLKSKYEVLLDATNQIADGNLDVAIAEDLGVFEPFRGEIQKIQSGFKLAVEQEVKSERMKTDLVTNVSHDLKTPLTAIITYANLLKEKDLPDTMRLSYIDILEQKSLRLKALIEDLFEISKATSQNATLNLMSIDIVSLMKQAAFELNERIEASTLEFRWKLPEQKVILTLDSQKTYRVFENLLINITKYAMPHTRVYISMELRKKEVLIMMKNVSAYELDFNPEEITDRFVRGDASRNTEGSGLGLAIAKSFIELQKGTLDISTDADLFKVSIRLPLDEPTVPKPEAQGQWLSSPQPEPPAQQESTAPQEPPTQPAPAEVVESEHSPIP